MPSTIPEQFCASAQKYPDKKFLAAKKNNRWQAFTYAETLHLVEKLAQIYLDLGFKKGDRIAIFSPSRPAWIIADLAILSLGGVSVPIHTTLSPNIIRYIINDSGARFLFVAGQENFYKLNQIYPETEKIEKIIYLDIVIPEDLKSEIFIEFNDLINRPSNTEPKTLPFVCSNCHSNANDLASIVYTSGTTGEPKGVMLSHKNFLSNVQSAIKAVSILHSDVFLSFLPLSHVLERTAGYYAAMSVGATIYYAESIKKLADNLKEIKPTIIICVPRIFERVYEKILDKIMRGKNFKKQLFFKALKSQSEIHHAQRENRPVPLLHKVQTKFFDLLICRKIRQALGGRLRFAVSGGASLSQKIARFFEDIGLKIIEGYGLTETAPILTVNRLDNYEFGTVGLPLEEVELKISPDKEIIVRGPNIMLGYWQNPTATSEVLTADNWFYTGDLGFINHRGLLTIIGRKKEILVTAGGKNVPPEPVENALQLSKYIAQSMIIGNNRPYISALIVPDFEKLLAFAKEKKLENLNREALIKNETVKTLFTHEIEHQMPDISDHEKVKKFTLLIHEFTQETEELTPTLKLRRAVIQHKYEREIEAMYNLEIRN